jgi:hypothetical protein
MRSVGFIISALKCASLRQDALVFHTDVVGGIVTCVVSIIDNKLLRLLSIIKIRTVERRATRRFARVFQVELDAVNQQA